jgi:hypothetical protein
MRRKTPVATGSASSSADAGAWSSGPGTKRGYDLMDEFEYGLDVILDGIERELEP